MMCYHGLISHINMQVDTIIPNNAGSVVYLGVIIFFFDGNMKKIKEIKFLFLSFCQKF